MVDSHSNESKEGDSSHKSSITNKEKLENENEVTHKLCCIHFLYHFDLGSKYLEDGIDKNEFRHIKDVIKHIKDVIKDTIKEDWIKDPCPKEDLKIRTPTYLLDVNPENYPIDIRNLHIELNLLEEDNSRVSLDGYEMNLAEAHIVIFDTGVATVNLRFELNFDKELDPKKVYQAYVKIYRKAKECLNENATDNKKNSEELKIFKRIHHIIKEIRTGLQVRECQLNLYKQGDESTLSPMPFFWIPKMEWNKSKQFFSLLYLKSHLAEDILDSRIRTNDQLKEVESCYSWWEENDESHFVCTWSAALLIDNDEKNIETYLGLLELCGYIYLNAWLLVDALEDIIKEGNIPKVGIEDERIKKIYNLRSRSYHIQQIKYTSLLSLWANSVEIFDNILEDAWQTEKTLFAKSEEQAEFLNSMFQYMYEDKQNELNKRVSNGLSLLQAMSIPFVLFLTLLTFANDSLICSFTSNNPNDVTWCTNNKFILLLIMIILIAGSTVGCYIWYKKRLKIKVNPIKQG